MENAVKASSPSPSITGSVLRESVEKALEVLEDSPIEGLFRSMCTLSGVATEEQLFSDYKLFERSLRKLLGDETANIILTFLGDEILRNYNNNRVKQRV
jgi:hypothetical protein